MNAIIVRQVFSSLVVGLVVAATGCGKGPSSSRIETSQASASLAAAAVPGEVSPTGKATQTNPQDAAPKGVRSGPFIFDTVEIDFGKMRDTEKRTADFHFTNGENHKVSILEVLKTCGCTITDVPKKTFEPGEAGVITVTFDAHHRQGKDRRPVTINTDNVEDPQAKVTILAEVIARIAIEPRAVYLGELERGAASEAKDLRIVSRNLELEIEKPRIDDPRFAFEPAGIAFEESEGDRVKVFRYRVRFAGGEEIRQNKGMVYLTTNDVDPSMKNISIVVLAPVVGPMRVLPAEVIQVSESKPNTAFTKEILLSHRQGKPWQLLSFELQEASDVFAPTLERVADDPARPGWVKLLLHGITPASVPTNGLPLKGRILLRFDTPEEPEHLINIEGAVRFEQKD